MLNFIKHIKENRAFLISLVSAVALLIFVSLSLWKQNAEIKGLEETHASLITELNNIEHAIGTRQAELDSDKSTSVKEITGVDPYLVHSDTSSANEYFAPAFNWKNSSEYDSTRQMYMESLGEDNSFTATYLPPDTKIETEKGELSYIDFEGLMVTMDSMSVVPMTVEGNRIRYIAFVEYYMHRNQGDIANTDALESSEAIIEFTVAGETGERHVTEVSARPGFQSTIQ